MKLSDLRESLKTHQSEKSNISNNLKPDINETGVL